MDPIAENLSTQSVLLLDGGLATELERRGADLNHELWSARVLLDKPDLLREVHLAFLRAGADIIASASYQASVEGLGHAGLDKPGALDLMRNSVTLAREARAEFGDEQGERLRPLVAASIGPYGACLADGSEYTGTYDLSAQQLVNFHRPRLEALLEGGPDIVAFETIPSLHEAEALVLLLEDYPDCLAWLSFSCRDGHHVSHGETFAACAALADQTGQIVAVGVNCTHPKWIPALLESAPGCSKPLMAYPNAGEDWDATAKKWVPGTYSKLDAEQWVRAGARIVGGCCRTTPG